MENTFKCILEERGIILQFGEEKYLKSYEEAYLPWDKAKEWAKKKGGDLFPWEHSIEFAEHLNEVNDLLRKAGKEIIGSLWTNREHATCPNCAWLVNMTNGNVNWNLKDFNYTVRAVSAL